MNLYSSLRTCMFTVILLGLLTACGIAGAVEPSHLIVQRGLAKYNEVITLQLSQTQQHPSIRPQIPSFKINRLAIAEQIPLMVQNLPTYQIRGTYNLTILLPSRRSIQQQNPFEIYLQRQKEGKTWRLLLPQSAGRDTWLWLSYSI